MIIFGNKYSWLLWMLMAPSFLFAQSKISAIGFSVAPTLNFTQSESIQMSYSAGLSYAFLKRIKHSVLLRIEPTIEYAPFYETVYPASTNVEKLRSRYDYCRVTLPVGIVFRSGIEIALGAYYSYLPAAQTKTFYLDKSKSLQKLKIGNTITDDVSVDDYGWLVQAGYMTGRSQFLLTYHHALANQYTVGKFYPHSSSLSATFNFFLYGKIWAERRF